MEEYYLIEIEILNKYRKTSSKNTVFNIYEYNVRFILIIY